MPNIITLRPIALDTRRTTAHAPQFRRLTSYPLEGEPVGRTQFRERPLQMSDARAIRVGQMPSRPSMKRQLSENRTEAGYCRSLFPFPS
jgi:hypothetical protein